MGNISEKIILSYREGCSGSWLGEILNICKFGGNPQINFRQDINGVPRSVYHFDGHQTDNCAPFLSYNNQPFITCHADNYELLKTQWPDSVVYRIIPKTYVLDAIASSWYKLKPKNSSTVDHAFEYIKTYYRLHTEIDPKFGIVIDYGKLRDKKWVQTFVEQNKMLYHQTCNSFIFSYWGMQKKSNYKIIPPRLTMYEIINTLDMGRDVFYVALAIFVYEKSNNLLELQRNWSIDELTTCSDLLKLFYTE
jgi:hypothetical protein